MTDKILVLSLTNSAGGAEQCLKIVAEETQSPILYLRKSSINTLNENTKNSTTYVTSLPLIFGFLMLPIKLFKYRKNHTLVSSHAYLNGYLGILKRIGFLKNRLIARESTNLFIRYSGVKLKLYHTIYKIGYPVINKIVCQNKTMAEQLIRHNPYLIPNRVEVILNPIDVQKAITLANSEKLNLNYDFICSAGRLIPIKGFDLLINAFSEIHKSQPKLKLLILGDGPEKEKLNNLIHQLNLQNHVFLIGFKHNPFVYFKEAKCCVVSSILEGFPNVLLQMMAVNYNVVSTLCAGGIEDIPNIISTPTNNIKMLSDGILKALQLVEKETTFHHEYLLTRTPEKFVKKLLAHPVN